MKIGVLALQGAIEEHLSALTKCGVEAVRVTRAEQIKEINGLIIPGGESTTFGKLARIYNIDKEIIKAAENGLPIWGTCAGMIFLAKEILNPVKPQNLLGLLDISVERNASGRQVDSFEQELSFPEAGIDNFNTIFIRAPYVRRIGENVKILGKYKDDIIFIRHCNIIATSFHPELRNDLRFHEYFIHLCSGGV